MGIIFKLVENNENKAQRNKCTKSQGNKKSMVCLGNFENFSKALWYVFSVIALEMLFSDFNDPSKWSVEWV